MADEKIIFSMNGVGKILPHNNRVILKDIYLSFFYGAKIGIVGLNGSGKSTLMKIITCFIPPTSGNVEVYGNNIFDNPLEIRRNIGYLPEHNPLYLEMYVRMFCKVSLEMQTLFLSHPCISFN